MLIIILSLLLVFNSVDVSYANMCSQKIDTHKGQFYFIKFIPGDISDGGVPGILVASEYNNIFISATEEEIPKYIIEKII